MNETYTPNPDRETATIDGRVTRFYDWAEVANAYRQWTQDRSPAPRDSYAAEVVRKCADASASGFHGATSAQIRERLDNGYDLPRLEGVKAPTADEAQKPRWRWSDNPDGEYQHDAFINGETDYYLSRDRRGPRPGINVLVNMTFSAYVNAQMVSGYGVWVGQALRAIQAAGFDVSVAITIKTSRIVRGESKNDTRISVKRFGQTNMGSDWSAIFSPGGFRHLCFVAQTIPAVDSGQTIEYGLGIPEANNKFDAAWDPETRTLEFKCDSGARGSDFPADQMTDAFTKARDRF